jgi:hypothetical protein
MNLNMKKDFLKTVLACLLTIVALSACKKDEEGEPYIITAAVENGDRYNTMIDAVRAEIEYDEQKEGYRIANAEYQNGGFTIILPAKVNSLYLVPLEDDIPDGLLISNLNAKTVNISLNAYKSNDNVGAFYLWSEGWEGLFIYADRDVSIAGDYDDYYSEEGITYTEMYNLSMDLEKGWNIVYAKATQIKYNTYLIEMTTEAPYEAKWYFDLYDTESYEYNIRPGIPFLSSKQRFHF